MYPSSLHSVNFVVGKVWETKTSTYAEGHACYRWLVRHFVVAKIARATKLGRDVGYGQLQCLGIKEVIPDGLWRSYTTRREKQCNGFQEHQELPLSDKQCYLLYHVVVKTLHEATASVGTMTIVAETPSQDRGMLLQLVCPSPEERTAVKDLTVPQPFLESGVVRDHVISIPFRDIVMR